MVTVAQLICMYAIFGPYCHSSDHRGRGVSRGLKYDHKILEQLLTTESCCKIEDFITADLSLKDLFSISAISQA